MTTERRALRTPHAKPDPLPLGHVVGSNFQWEIVAGGPPIPLPPPASKLQLRDPGQFSSFLHKNVWESQQEKLVFWED